MWLKVLLFLLNFWQFKKLFDKIDDFMHTHTNTELTHTHTRAVNE